MLLEHGADPNIECNLRLRAIHLAAVKHSSSTVRSLLKYQADVNVSDRHGITPLYISADENDIKIARPAKMPASLPTSSSSEYVVRYASSA